MINHLNLHVPQPPALCQGGRLPARLPARRAPAAPRASTNGVVNNGASANGARRLALADPPPVSEEVQALMTEQGIADLETSGLLYLSNDARARSPLERPSQRSCHLCLGPLTRAAFTLFLDGSKCTRRAASWHRERASALAGALPSSAGWAGGCLEPLLGGLRTSRHGVSEVSRSCAAACQLLGQSVGGALGGGSTCQGSRLCRAVST